MWSAHTDLWPPPPSSFTFITNPTPSVWQGLQWAMGNWKHGVLWGSRVGRFLGGGDHYWLFCSLDQSLSTHHMLGFSELPQNHPIPITSGGFCLSLHRILCPNFVILLLHCVPEGVSHAFRSCINPFINC